MQTILEMTATCTAEGINLPAAQWQWQRQRTAALSVSVVLASRVSGSFKGSLLTCVRACACACACACVCVCLFYQALKAILDSLTTQLIYVYVYIYI